MFLLRLIWVVVHALFVRRADLVAENLALRQQIIVFHRKAETSTRGALAFSASNDGLAVPTLVIVLDRVEKRIAREILGA